MCLNVNALTRGFSSFHFLRGLKATLFSGCVRFTDLHRTSRGMGEGAVGRHLLVRQIDQEVDAVSARPRGCIWQNTLLFDRLRVMPEKARVPHGPRRRSQPLVLRNTAVPVPYGDDDAV